MKKNEFLVKYPEKGVEGFPIRLKEIIGSMTIKDFAAAIGMSEGGFRKYLPPTKSVPAYDKLVAMSCLTGVNIDWLATGRGEKYPPRPVSSVENNFATLSACDEEFELIDGYHVTIGEVGCGIGEPTVRRKLAFRKKWLEWRGFDADCLKIFFVKSDIEGGMISGGDSVMINTADTVLSDGVFAIEIDGSILIRWFSYRIDGGFKVQKDINQEESEIISKENTKGIRVLGRVVWLGKDFK